MESETGREVLMQINSAEERIALYSNVIAPGAPKAMVALVFHYAKLLQLDPLRKEVMLISMDRKDERGQWNKDYSVIVNVHGLNKMAAREKDFAGMLSAVVYPGEPCVIHADGTVEHHYDVQSRAKLMKEHILPIGSWCTVSRSLHGERVKFTTYLPFEQVAQYKWEKEQAPGPGKPQFKKTLRAVWASRPDWMCEKCSIAFSVRKAYDHVVGRVYVPEEVGLLSDAEGGITIPEGSTDSVATIVEDETMMTEPTMDGERVAPSVAAGHVPGSDVPKDVVIEGAEPTPTPWTGGTTPPEDQPPTMEELRDRVLQKAKYGTEVLFKDPPRKFIQESQTGRMWLVDQEVLTLMAKEPYKVGTGRAALDLASLDADGLQAAFNVIRDINRAKESAKGRAPKVT